MLKVLCTDPRAKDAIEGNRTKAVTGLPWIGDPEYLVVSADLTAASDLISHDLALSLWSGLDEILTPEQKEILNYCLGPQWIMYPDGQDVLSTNGILMGLPLTWVTLNLL